ncbi:hypothetical protein, partial [Winogradskyella sp.]
MKIGLRFIVFMLLISTFNDSEAQELPTILPTSPEASSFAKFTEVPVSHYTGVPNISIPISSFNVGDKVFPVSLSYHARGIQVSEIPSRVGLGWTLNAGGQISRQIRNKADDGLTGYTTAANTLKQALIDDPNPTLNEVISLVDNNLNVDWQPDMIPDVFSLQVNDISSKFMFNYEDFKPIAQKYGDLLIEGKFTDGNINGFKVTDEDGYIYDFSHVNLDRVERKYTFRSIGGGYIVNDPLDGTNMATEWSAYAYPNAWYLSSITSPNGDEAIFIYNKEINYVYRRSGDKYNFSEIPQDQLHNHTDLVVMEQHQLSEIRYDYKNGSYKKIVFNATTPREDMHSEASDNSDYGSNDVWPSEAKELDKVEIYDQKGFLVKSFELHQHYMDSRDNVETNPANPNHLPLLLSMNPSANKRLVLDSITERGSDNISSKPPYKFAYDQTILPNRHSNSKDYWGFYNGKNNGQFLAGSGIDRRVDTILATASLLEKITYPTGGSTRFTYEHNIGHKGVEYDDIYIPPVNPSSSVSFTLSNLAISNVSGSSYTPAPAGIFNGGFYRSEVKTLNSNSLVSVGSSSHLPVYNGVNQIDRCVSSINGGPFSDCQFRIRLVRVDGPSGNEQPVSWVNPINFWSDSLPVIVDAGKYWLEIDVPFGWNPNALAGSGQYFNFHLIADDQVINQTHLYAAGKRIKQIEFLDSVDNVVSKKTYDYKDSGVILGITDFSYVLNVGGTDHIFTPYHLYNHYQGNTIGYKFVDEYYGDENENIGKRSYEFLITKDSGLYVDRPRSPPTDNEWLRGLPLKITEYRNDQGIFKKVKELENSYQVVNDLHTNVLPEGYPFSLQAFPNNPKLTPETIIIDFDYTTIPATVDVKTPSNAPSNLSDSFYNNYLFEKTDTFFRMPFVWKVGNQDPYSMINPNTTGWDYKRAKIFHFTGGTLDKGKTVETNYDDNENITLVTETETAYNYAKHYQASSVRTVTSGGEPIFQTFIYPQEIVSNYEVHPKDPITNEVVFSADPNTALAEQHRFVPLETSSLVDSNDNGVADLNEELNKTKTIYDWDGDILEPY